ncbi:histidine phosphatase family protein [Demequina litorisediminis]|uniref:histidine phosphatase family protein n=1 Tax=Demequina litorisediminis TaxID=1849022 RepID=UPI003D66E5C8
MTYTLILLRHGESDWNSKNLFTGWVDVEAQREGLGRGQARRRACSRPRASFRTWCTRRCCVARS